MKDNNNYHKIKEAITNQKNNEALNTIKKVYIKPELVIFNPRDIKGGVNGLAETNGGALGVS